MKGWNLLREDFLLVERSTANAHTLMQRYNNLTLSPTETTPRFLHIKFIPNRILLFTFRYVDSVINGSLDLIPVV